jgi:hypothetical protein
MTPVTWAAPTRGGGAAKSLPIHVSLMKAGGTPSARDVFIGSKQLPLFSGVKLVRPWRAEGESLPVGALGTIVESLNKGDAYIVEFFRPRHCVVTVYDHALAPDNE